MAELDLSKTIAEALRRAADQISPADEPPQPLPEPAPRFDFAPGSVLKLSDVTFTKLDKLWRRVRRMSDGADAVGHVPTSHVLAALNGKTVKLKELPPIKDTSIIK